MKTHTAFARLLHGRAAASISIGLAVLIRTRLISLPRAPRARGRGSAAAPGHPEAQPGRGAAEALRRQTLLSLGALGPQLAAPWQSVAGAACGPRYTLAGGNTAGTPLGSHIKLL